MVLRVLLRYLASHPELVDRLSETWVIRRLAQLTAYSYFKAKEIGEDGVHKGVDKIRDSEILKRMEELPEDESDRMSSFSRTFAKELRGGMKELSDKIEKDREKEL
ncbi:protein NCBP2AS2 homolog [Ptychodera flava]|uniref:protein NCBP2AS2 homolog n=1 Tax=Ptychodera flava TaxID=63121 RepID=UPI00396A77F2